MPQVILEYSNNLKVKKKYLAFFSKLHGILTEKLDVDLLNCKSRAVRRKTNFVADGDPLHAFAHLTLRIFEGHNPVAKSEAGEAALKLMMDFYRKSSKNLIFQPTVEFVEIKKENYFKLSVDDIFGSNKPDENLSDAKDDE